MADDFVPGWLTCQRAAGCAGVRAAGGTACLEHLTPAELTTFIGTLRPGADLDARGTTLSPALLARFVDAVRDRDGNAVFGGSSEPPLFAKRTLPAMPTSAVRSLARMPTFRMYGSIMTPISTLCSSLKG